MLKEDAAKRLNKKTKAWWKRGPPPLEGYKTFADTNKWTLSFKKKNTFYLRCCCRKGLDVLLFLARKMSYVELNGDGDGLNDLHTVTTTRRLLKLLLLIRFTAVQKHIRSMQKDRTHVRVGLNMDALLFHCVIQTLWLCTSGWVMLAVPSAPSCCVVTHTPFQLLQ